MTDADKISVKEYVETIFEERGKYYDSRLASLEKTFEAAISSMLREVSKAEQAQHEYNIRSNEFRGQLDDQAKTLMPRTETAVLVKNLEDRLSSLSTQADARISSLRSDIATLREATGGITGHQSGHQETWSQAVSLIALLLSVVTIVTMIMLKM